ncbi:unnamed protein product [Ilex paraguariensis]|uniref:Uncharacterized protein n=1 Tax=Ilex paraguariensis TaxID=185542 RepID=A0ABC8UE83_9AQUA
MFRLPACSSYCFPSNFRFLLLASILIFILLKVNTIHSHTGLYFLISGLSFCCSNGSLLGGILRKRQLRLFLTTRKAMYQLLQCLSIPSPHDIFIHTAGCGSKPSARHLCVALNVKKIDLTLVQ